MTFPIVLLILSFLARSTFVQANLNIFLDHREVRKLLGLSAELYYVREGVINEYALNFMVPVPAHMPDLHFCWQSIGDKPVPYTWDVEVVGGDPEAMQLPTLNISQRGSVPHRLQIFRLRFPCTGKTSSEMDVVLHLNVSMIDFRKNITQLKFKRKKICLQEDRVARNESVLLQPESLVTTNSTLYIAVGSACTLILILLTVTSIIYVRKRKALPPDGIYDTATYCSNPNVFLSDIYRGSSNGSASYATIASFQKVPLTSASSTFQTRVVNNSNMHSGSRSVASYKSSVPTSNKEVAAYQVSGLHQYLNPYQNVLTPPRIPSSNISACSTPLSKPRLNNHSSYAQSVISNGSQASYESRMTEGEKLQRLAVPRFRITLRNLLHEGTFGRVYRGLFLHPDTSREGEVLVKTVSEYASPAQKAALVSEGTFMCGLQHRHILGVLGFCADGNHPPLVVYPWTNRGNLKKFLLSCRNGSGNSCSITDLPRLPDGSLGAKEVRTALLTQDVVDMAVQVTLAMLYLHRHRILHRDLAARNCVVDERLRVKVTDTALSRDLFPNDYHCLGDNENRPIKWLALESLSQREFSPASDVWSFGVLLWELTTLAQQPYVEVDPFEMETYLKDDYRLAQPLNCPDELFAVMACCWIADPKERPTFLQLLACLQDFHTALGRFI